MASFRAEFHVLVFSLMIFGSSASPFLGVEIPFGSKGKQSTPSAFVPEMAGTPQIAATLESNCERDRSELVGFSESVMTGLKEYTITDKTKNMLGFGAVEWLVLAERYHLDGIRVLAEKSIGGNLDTGNALETFRLGFLSGSATLKASALTFIKLNLKAISETTAIEEFAKASPQGVGELFGLLVDYPGVCKE